MKTLTLVFAGVLAVALGAPSQLTDHGNLKKDLDDIEALGPGPNSFSELAHWYTLNDKETFAIFQYLESYEFQQAMNFATDQPGFKEFKEWIFAHYHDDDEDEVAYGRNSRTSIWDEVGDKKPGWKGFKEQWWRLYPYEEVKELVKQKIALGGLFAEFWQRLTSLKSAYEHVLTLPEIQNVINKLNSLGYDFDATDKFIRETLGWN